MALYIKTTSHVQLSALWEIDLAYYVYNVHETSQLLDHQAIERHGIKCHNVSNVLLVHRSLERREICGLHALFIYFIMTFSQT